MQICLALLNMVKIIFNKKIRLCIFTLEILTASILILLVANCSFIPYSYFGISFLSQKTRDHLSHTPKKNYDIAVITEHIDQFIYFPNDIKDIVNKGIDSYEKYYRKNRKETLYIAPPDDLGPFFMVEAAKEFFNKRFARADFLTQKMTL
jgi:hypothetical protein